MLLDFFEASWKMGNPSYCLESSSRSCSPESVTKLSSKG